MDALPAGLLMPTRLNIRGIDYQPALALGAIKPSKGCISAVSLGSRHGGRARDATEAPPSSGGRPLGRLR